MIMKQLKLLIIGAGSRGNAYARAITASPKASVYAVAEPDPYKRQLFGQRYIWGSADVGKPKHGQEFAGWCEWIDFEKDRRLLSGARYADEVENEGVDGLLICTLDETHIEILTAIAEAGLRDIHVLSEKPLALSVTDCLSVYAARKDAASIFSIGHVLRYSPHNLLLRRLIREEKVIGDVVSIEHTEPVGFWHFAHSYVRGNWRRATPGGDGSLLTKSCHDLDFILWLLEQDDDGADALRTISSSGHLTQFQRGRKPPAAGTATNCLSCPIEKDCIYSAVRIYRDQHLAKGKRGWPVKIVCQDIEEFYNIGPTAAGEHLLDCLRENYDSSSCTSEEVASRPWYGRCVWECDNNVCDDQVVTLTWNENALSSGSVGGRTATFHMVAHTAERTDRRGRIYGTHGEITYDTKTIMIYSFETRQKSVIEVPKMPPEEEQAHGGGDHGLARAFIDAVDAVVNHEWEVEKAQMQFVGCSLKNIVRAHAVVFAAEEARTEEKLVKWKEWWDGQLEGKLEGPRKQQLQ
jgi:predicted dehydrogenase